MSFECASFLESTCEILSIEWLPAWIQAVGSIFALGVAIYISRSAAKHAELSRRKAILAIAEAAHTHACQIRNAMDMMGLATGNNTQIYKVYHKVVIEGVVKALQGIPMHEVGSSNGVLAILSLSNQMVFLGDSIETLIDGPYKIPSVVNALESIDKGDHARRQEYCARIYENLQNNVRGHLDLIDENFESLKKSIKR